MRFLAGIAAVVASLVIALFLYQYFYVPAQQLAPKPPMPPPAKSLAELARQPNIVGHSPEASTAPSAPRPSSVRIKPKPVPASVRAHEFYDSALAKRRDGKTEEAVALFRQAAELGDGSAMVELGESYRAGDGVSQDGNAALRWFHRAADAGDSSAMLFLGAMYLLGDGVENNDTEAAQWFQHAADRGNAAGMYDLATLYEEGRGVTRDPDKAQQLYQRSAKLGNDEAQKRLAQLASRK